MAGDSDGVFHRRESCALGQVASARRAGRAGWRYAGVLGGTGAGGGG
ncbi:hypothetical protein HGI47_02950 [Novosphingobium sp. ERN07]|nr:hypothetical protein [Novosphingobium sp. ERN07]NLR69835.1 hypothetical protein [Novosphingobium sp. ERN07]